MPELPPPSSMTLASDTLATEPDAWTEPSSDSDAMKSTKFWDSRLTAVMTELLLRGPQTLGELRTRASRMHPFPDLNTMKSVVSGLAEKGLVESLTPPGRGQTFSHTLYPPQERQFLNAKLEKQNAAKSPVAAGESTDTNRTAVDQLLDRLETVNNRIDTLEKRLAELENSNSSD